VSRLASSDLVESECAISTRGRIGLHLSPGEHCFHTYALLQEMVRVSSRVVVLSTPNRRPKYTKRDGRPMNRWHLREWSFEELEAILQSISTVRVEWSFLDGPWEGPFECRCAASQDTMALTPALLLESSLFHHDKLGDE